MKRKTCLLSKAVKWCASKCRALLGAFGFMLPAVPAPAPVRWRSFRRVALLLVFLFVLLAPMFFRDRPDPGGLFFACPVRIRSYCYATTFGPTDFTYTGAYTWVDDGAAGWRLKFLTSGTFTPLKNVTVDVFLVGGGAGGHDGVANLRGGGGGGGGRTATSLNLTLTANTAYSCVIGAGGGRNSNGGTTSISQLSLSAIGGTASANCPGGAGGSGGGGGDSGAGGSDGANGTSSNYAGGAGQGTTTREFGTAGQPLYAGGGGAGGGQYSYSSGGGAGGAGGGANGGAQVAGVGGTAAANTGGGGGGGGSDDDSTTGNGGSGGSGIIIFRNKR